jgi:AcrR family transcriptional regulator
MQEKKRLILEALKRRLASNVYSRVTVQDVADEAGYSKGGILHYFPSKEDMYLELMREIFRDIEADHARVLRENFNSSERAGISALYSVERFVLDRSTIRILINLIMYGYEDEKIMKPIANSCAPIIPLRGAHRPDAHDEPLTQGDRLRSGVHRQDRAGQRAVCGTSRGN